MTGGIVNIGNTCYMNTALQCLGSLKPFMNILYQHTNKPLCSALINLYSTHGTRNPRALASLLQSKLKSIHILEQNDVAEFISLFLDMINREIAINNMAAMENTIAHETYKNTAFDRQRRKMDINWMFNTGKEYSLLVNAFYGQYISQIHCAYCNKIWHNYEIFHAIYLALPTAKDPTMMQLLNAYFKDRSLSEWKCDKCGFGARSDQSIALWRNPTILTVILQRFDVSRGIHKNTTCVQVPLDLDLSSYTLGRTHKKYTLKSVAFHSGSYFGGHYHCICRNDTDNTFTLYDDDTVVRIESPDLSHGYVFFYEAVQ